jgi:hypothetical protein
LTGCRPKRGGIGLVEAGRHAIGPEALAKV